MNNIYDTKEFKRLAKLIGDTNAREFVNQPQSVLDEAIVTATTEIKKAIDDVEANESYQEALTVVNDFKAALRETLAPKKAKIAVATLLRVNK